MDEPDVTHLNFDRLSWWQCVYQMQLIVWGKSSTDYLSLLQERRNWRTPEHKVKPGSVVLIKDDNLSHLRWRLGRVESTASGEDGVDRDAVTRSFVCVHVWIS